MRLLSVNVSFPKAIPGMNRKSGIFKMPVVGRVMLRTLNLDGDRQADLGVHGGSHKAVYVYTFENYRHWKRKLRRTDFRYGQFGENFTVEGMPDDEINVGDIFKIGDAKVEVTQPRVPCFKLGIKMSRPEFPGEFLASLRVGFYLRVLEEGKVGAGDSIERVHVDPGQLTVRGACHLLYFDQGNLDGIRKALHIKALSPHWRESFEKLLEKAPSSGQALSSPPGTDPSA